MRPILLACTLAMSSLCAAQQPPLTADTIMARVALNQDRSDSERAHYLYVQHSHTVSRRGNTILCEETADFRVTPTPDGSHQDLLNLNGRLRQKGADITYTHLLPPGPNHNEDDVHLNIDDSSSLDRGLVEEMRSNLTIHKSKDAKDGIDPNLFPLTSKSQAGYQFHLLGRSRMNDRDCFHIAFSPKDKDDFGWKGDAYIDATAFQPVVLRTTLSRKIPFAVRAFLGTNVPGLGFTIVYAPQPAGQPNGLWFPTSFGTEFKLHVLFFFNREIIFNAENRDFEKTRVTSRIIDKPERIIATPETSTPPKTPETPNP
jgi:hypothetical protein